jgi:preprotein translocase subunit Sec61beta
VGNAPKRAGPLTVAKAVFWSFLGIRRRAEHEADAVRLTPAQVIVAGLIGAALFVATLLLIVKFVISRAAG